MFRVIIHSKVIKVYLTAIQSRKMTVKTYDSYSDELALPGPHYDTLLRLDRVICLLWFSH